MYLDGEDKLLGSAVEVAQRWYAFLAKKFAATEEESRRAPLPPLSTAGQGHLREEEILAGLQKMGNDKATGDRPSPKRTAKDEGVSLSSQKISQP